MVKKESPGQCRRELFVQTGIAFLVLIAKRYIPKASPGEHSESDRSTNSQKTSGEALKLTAPTAADFVKLGEHLSYLSNLPTGARVFDAVREIGGFLEILRDRDLPATCAAARSLWNLRCHNGCGSRVLSEQSKLSFAVTMIPIRRALEAEVNHFDDL